MANVLKKRFLIPTIAAILVCDFFIAGSVALADSQVDSSLTSSVKASVWTYPNGSLLRSPSGQIYVITNGFKHHIATLAELSLHYQGRAIIDVSDSVLLKYETDPSARVKLYPNGSMLRDSEGRIYIITNGFKHHIINSSELWLYRGKKIINVDAWVLAAYDDDAVVQFYPNGTLLKGSADSIFLISGTSKYRIKNLTELAVYGHNRPTIKVDDAVLAQYNTSLTVLIN